MLILNGGWHVCGMLYSRMIACWQGEVPQVSEDKNVQKSRRNKVISTSQMIE